jgi:opacity protein-like surface antigen
MRLLPLVLAVMIPGVARAQAITLGAHGGVNVSQTGGPDTAIAPVAGASVDIGLFPPITLRFAAEYSERGISVAASTGGGGSAGAPADYTLDYLAIPISLRYDLATGTVPVYLLAGTTLGALLAATEQRGGATNDVRDQLRPVDFSLDVGGGIGYRVSPHVAVMLDVRYSFGLTDDAQPDASLGVDSLRGRNLSVVLGVTYRFAPSPSPPTMPGMPGAPSMPMPFAAP